MSFDLAFDPVVPVAEFHDTAAGYDEFCAVFIYSGDFEYLPEYMDAATEFYPDSDIAIIRFDPLDKEWSVDASTGEKYNHITNVVGPDTDIIIEHIEDKFMMG